MLLPKLFLVNVFSFRNEKVTSHKTVQTYVNAVLGDEASFFVSVNSLCHY